MAPLVKENLTWLLCIKSYVFISSSLSASKASIRKNLPVSKIFYLALLCTQKKKTLNNTVVYYQHLGILYFGVCSLSRLTALPNYYYTLVLHFYTTVNR